MPPAERNRAGGRESHREGNFHSHKHGSQTHTRTHTPTKSQHFYGMYLATDVTAAALACLPVGPPCPRSFLQASP